MFEEHMFFTPTRTPEPQVIEIVAYDFDARKEAYDWVCAMPKNMDKVNALRQFINDELDSLLRSGEPRSALLDQAKRALDSLLRPQINILEPVFSPRFDEVIEFDENDDSVNDDEPRVFVNQ